MGRDKSPCGLGRQTRARCGMNDTRKGRAMGSKTTRKADADTARGELGLLPRSERGEVGELSPVMRQLILSFTEPDSDRPFDRAALARRPLRTA
jgi:hypothetical protein